MNTKRFLIVLSAVLVGALIFALPAAAAPESAFTGRWEATDIVDGSDLTLNIRGSGSGTLRLLLRDDRATVACPTTEGVAVARGTGTISGDDLTYNGRGFCLTERNRFSFSGVLTYDAATDTLTDVDGTTYNRVRRANPFRGRWEATDIVDGSNLSLTIAGRLGGTYRLSMHDDRATVACPATAGVAIARGTGTVSGSDLTYSGDGICPRERNRFPFSGVLTYDTATDTLTDVDGTTYNRVSP